LVVAVLIGGCAAPAPDIRSDYDRNVDFSRYRTYNIMPGAGRRPDGQYDTLIGERVTRAIHREMEARGYQRSPEPDLLVNFSVTVQSVTKVSQVPRAQPYPYAYGYRSGRYATWSTYTTYDTWVREYEEGTLLIDIVDRERQQLVWEAAGRGRVTKEKLEDIEGTVNRAVAELFKRYPFRAGL
jgi:hypothetical protein